MSWFRVLAIFQGPFPTTVFRPVTKGGSLKGFDRFDILTGMILQVAPKIRCFARASVGSVSNKLAFDLTLLLQANLSLLLMEEIRRENHLWPMKTYRKMGIFSISTGAGILLSTVSWKRFWIIEVQHREMLWFFLPDRDIDCYDLLRESSCFVLLVPLTGSQIYIGRRYWKKWSDIFPKWATWMSQEVLVKG